MRRYFAFVALFVFAVCGLATAATIHVPADQLVAQRVMNGRIDTGTAEPSDYRSLGNDVIVQCPIIVESPFPDSFGIPIRITNDVSLGGFTLGFSWSSDDVQVTSVNMANTIGATTAFYSVKIVAADRKVRVGWIDFTGMMPIPPQTNGLAFTLCMKVQNGTRWQCVNLDSSFVPPAGPFIFSPRAGGKIVPNYVDCGDADVIIGAEMCPITCGDADTSRDINIADPIYICHYVFRNGPVPLDPSGGDVDCDHVVCISDAVYLVNYIFVNGAPAPCPSCHYPPIIDSIVASPPSVLPGGSSAISVAATDPDGDTLTYSYAAAGGSISGNGASVTWNAPAAAGLYRIDIRVTDGAYVVRGFVDVSVVEPPTRIMGTLTLQGQVGDLAGIKVGIYTSINDWANRNPVQWTIVPDSGTSVQYALEDVVPGNYYLDAWKDSNLDGVISSGDLYGWFGAGTYPFGTLTEFSIADHETKVIDVVISAYK